jgi:hypothetical protein
MKEKTGTQSKSYEALHSTPFAKEPKNYTIMPF